MREIPLPNCSREFIQEAAANKQRLDGRDLHDYRSLKILYGIDRGSCQVEMGQTRVFVQVSSEVAEPKQQRPTDGILFINVEMSPMTAPNIEVGRPTDQCVEIQRILERTLKESRCLDLESLCIVSSKQVWQIRVDIHCLNNAGNLLDACSIAGIAALAHFRLPDVTIHGEEVTIHSLTERDPIPLSLHHLPICSTFAFFGLGKVAFIDPSYEEERVMEGKLVVGMNKHRQLCCLQSAGSMLLMREQVLRCSNIAVQKVTQITEIIHQAQDADTKARAAGQKFGFLQTEHKSRTTDISSDADQLLKLVRTEEQTTEKQDRAESDDDSIDDDISDVMTADDDVKYSRAESRVPPTRSLGEGGQSTWSVDDEEMTDLSNVKLNQQKQQQSQKHKGARSKLAKPVEISDYNIDEDEETVVLQPESLGFKTPVTQGAKPKKKKKRAK